MGLPDMPQLIPLAKGIQAVVEGNDKVHLMAKQFQADDAKLSYKDAVLKVYEKNPDMIEKPKEIRDKA